MLNRPKPVVLLILDGLGYTLDKDNNTAGIINAAVLAEEAVAASLLRVVDALKLAPLIFLNAGGSLPDPAPTMLSMLGVAQAVNMTGLSPIKSV